MAKAQLVITLNEKGDINVGGPLGQKMLCYGMLDCARDAIKDYNDKAAQSQSPIEIAQPADIPDHSKDRHMSFDAPLRSV